MTTLQHKKYGALGSEFIVHHRTYKPRRLVLSLLLTSMLAYALQVYEIFQDVVVLWLMTLGMGALLFYRLFYKVKQEAVLVLPSVGVQVKTQYWLGGLETHFFDKACVRGIVINEAVTMHSVLCYLAVLLTSGSSDCTQRIFPLFTHSWPKQQDLVYIYQAVEKMRQKNQPSPPPHPASSPPSPSQGDGEKRAEVVPTAETAPVTLNNRKGSEEQPLKRRTRQTRSTKS